MEEEKAVHKDYCPRFSGDLDDLAYEINQMTHESRAKLYDRLAYLADIGEIAERHKKRPRYAGQLKGIMKTLRKLEHAELECWAICEPRTEVESRK